MQIVLIFALGFGFAIGILLTALFLRLVCSLYNEMAGGAGSSSSVPEPSLGEAMGIAFVVNLVNAILEFVTRMSMDAGTGPLSPLVPLIILPVNLSVTAGILSAMLPTTFGRAVLVALVYVVVVVGVVIGVVALFAAFSR